MVQQLLRLTACLSLATLSSGCGVFGSDAAGPARVQDMVGWMERVHVESEVAAQRVAEAVQALKVLATQNFETNAVEAYAAYVAAVDVSEKQQKVLGDVVDPLKAAAEPVFSRWQADLERMQSETMRARSQKRLEATRRDYDSVVQALDPLMEAYRGFNASLRDHALFLSHDLNSGSLAAIVDDVQALDRTAHELGFGFGSALTAAQAYIHGSSLPVGATGPVGEPAAPSAGR